MYNWKKKTIHSIVQMFAIYKVLGRHLEQCETINNSMEVNKLIYCVIHNGWIISATT